MEAVKILDNAHYYSGMGFCALDQNGLILEHNEVFFKLFKKKALIGKKLADYIVEAEIIEEALLTLKNNEPLSVPLDFIIDNQTLYTIANIFIITNDQYPDKILGIFFTEISEYRIMESVLEERIQLEIEKNRQKEEIIHQQSRLATMGEMIGNIAHQWRQPLNILALVFQDIYIKFQLSNLDHDQMEKHYTKINNLIQYMSQTIDDFRTFFKNEDAEVCFDVQNAIESVFDLLGTRFSSNNTQYEINVISSGFVQGTENGFKQVIINLLNNAYEAIESKHVDQGQILISIEVLDNNSVCISVEDNGKGIPTEIINQVFEPYFTTKHQSQGTGLGLYMCKKIIEHHMMGKLEVENGKEGAKFKIILPIEKRTPPKGK